MYPALIYRHTLSNTYERDIASSLSRQKLLLGGAWWCKHVAQFGLYAVMRA